MECERCYHCNRLEEEDTMTMVDSSGGLFLFCGDECCELWEEEEIKKYKASQTSDKKSGGKE